MFGLCEYSSTHPHIFVWSRSQGKAKLPLWPVSRSVQEAIGVAQILPLAFILCAFLFWHIKGEQVDFCAVWVCLLEQGDETLGYIRL